MTEPVRGPDGLSEFRNISASPLSVAHDRQGRRVIAVVGIDRYRHWPGLRNAANDARGALAAFVRLGFEPFPEPVFDEAASADVLRGLVTDQLATLGDHDSVVVFFAGHGHTSTQMLVDVRQHEPVSTGYIIPVDGEAPGGSAKHWLRIDHWLDEISRIRAKHILVILDACHSGIALGSVVRGAGPLDEGLDRLAMRRSRRVITSARENEQALDTGPTGTHSLFTGLLIDALDGAIAAHGETVTGSALGLHLRERVRHHRGALQTPDFGAFALDRRGELLIRIATTTALAEQADRAAAPAASSPPAATAERPSAAAGPRDEATAWKDAASDAEARDRAEAVAWDIAAGDAEARERAER